VAAIRAAGLQSTPRVGTGHVFDTLSGPMFCCIIDMTYLCWGRAIDMRLLKEAQEENGHIRIKASKTKNTSGLIVDIFITPAIQRIIDRARAIKKKYKIISPYFFTTSKGNPYSKSGLTSMWERARARAALQDETIKEVQFKDLRALGATDAARAGKGREEIRARLVHTDSKTSEIYIKEAVPEKSTMELKLPWGSV
jgi:integrase